MAFYNTADELSNEDEHEDATCTEANVGIAHLLSVSVRPSHPDSLV